MAYPLSGTCTDAERTQARLARNHECSARETSTDPPAGRLPCCELQTGLPKRLRRLVIEVIELHLDASAREPGHSSVNARARFQFDTITDCKVVHAQSFRSRVGSGTIDAVVDRLPELAFWRSTACNETAE